MERLAQNIKKFRELKNLTQQHIAKSLDISQSQYQRYEAGQITMSGDLVDQVAEILGVDRELLYSFDERSIFQTGEHNAVSNGSGDIVYHPIDSKMKQLYETQIKLLEDKIRHLEEK